MSSETFPKDDKRLEEGSFKEKQVVIRTKIITECIKYELVNISLHRLRESDDIDTS